MLVNFFFLVGVSFLFWHIGMNIDCFLCIAAYWKGFMNCLSVIRYPYFCGNRCVVKLLLLIVPLLCICLVNLFIMPLSLVCLPPPSYERFGY